MPIQDLYIGLGSVVYALASVDGQLQAEERETLKQLLEQEPYGEIALYTLDWKKRDGEKAEAAYQSGCQRILENKMAFSPQMKAHFLDILRRVAEANEGISREESVVLHRFREYLDHF